MKEEQRLRRKYSVDTKILQLLILPVSVRQVSQKKDSAIEVDELIVFSLYTIKYSFVNTGFLKFVLVKQKFA